MVFVLSLELVYLFLIVAIKLAIKILNATTLTITRSLNNKNLLNSIIDPQENN
jgi:hypothetical protein